MGDSTQSPNLALSVTYKQEFALTSEGNPLQYVIIFGLQIFFITEFIRISCSFWFISKDYIRLNQKKNCFENCQRLIGF